MLLEPSLLVGDRDDVWWVCGGCVVCGADEDGAFGIRIENLLVVVKKQTAHAFNGKAYLGFEQARPHPHNAAAIIPDRPRWPARRSC